MEISLKAKILLAVRDDFDAIITNGQSALVIEGVKGENANTQSILQSMRFN